MSRWSGWAIEVEVERNLLNGVGTGGYHLEADAGGNVWTVEDGSMLDSNGEVIPVEGEGNEDGGEGAELR
jgi:hypothetical protein